VAERKLKLEEGILYRLVYKFQAGNYQWYKKEMWARYMGENEAQSVYEFSLRPLAGTQSMPKDWLLEAWEMPRTSTPKLPVSLGKYES
jgi:hypothetical protein